MRYSGPDVVSDSIDTAEMLGTRGATVHYQDGSWHARVWGHNPSAVDAKAATVGEAIREACLLRSLIEARGGSVPIIYGVGSPIEGGSLIGAMAILETGELVAGHICSSMGFVQHDLHGRESRQADYRARWPSGYEFRMMHDPDDMPEEVWARYRERYGG